MTPLRVLVLGGYGFFGRRLVERLSTQPRFHLIVAGRSQAKAEALIRELPKALSTLEARAFDVNDAALAQDIRKLDVQVVVHTAGPFQAQDYRVARACIAANTHYIDLADGRQFVCGIGCLNDEAVANEVSILSGASSVPALSSAVVDSLGKDLQLTHIDMGINPGNRADRGLATVAAILSYCGNPIRVWREGVWTTVAGWSKHWRHAYPEPMRTRWLTHCDIPDLELFPARYPGVQMVRFGAGLEVGLLHSALAFFSWARRLRLLPNLARFATFAKRASDLFLPFGTDTGGMYVRILGRDSEDRPVQRSWYLIAERGEGPYVPILATVALLDRMASGDVLPIGAMPCMGVLSLRDFENAAKGLAIRMATNPPMRPTATR
ncbi:MAG TPA: saccharopine dehydrogenase NADP-binding domain-containing protein [Burkholderiales bacterium]|nr:saccharopine dehydrogenase NADP-binding domain-containing protein [Burkholderiales bacterium]